MSTWQHKGTRVEMPADTSVRLRNGSRLERRTDEIFDHFNTGAGALNSAVPQHWVNTQAGSGTLFVSGAGAGSYAVGVSGATTDNAVELAGKKLGWNCSTRCTLASDRMVLEVRAKFVGTTAATDGDFLIGFGDAVTQASSLAYVVSAASAVTTGAPTEFVGFYYSSIPTSGALYGASGNAIGAISSIAGTDTVTALVSQDTRAAIVKDSTIRIFRLEVDSAANATFFIDDVYCGYIAAAYTANTEMTPYIAVIAKNSHAHTATIDYISVSAPYV